MTTKTAEDTRRALNAKRAAIEAQRPSRLSDRIGPIWFRLMVIAIAFAVLAGVMAVGFQAQPTPVSVVRNYLEAIRDKDVDAAMSYVSNRPTGARAQFLTPEALSDEWTINSVKDDEFTEGMVVAEMSAKTGKETLSLTTRDTPNGLVIENPFVEVSFAGLPYDYAEVNGLVAPARTYVLFPGAYTFYESADDTFDRSEEPQLLTIDEYDDDSISDDSMESGRTPPTKWKVTDTAVKKAQDALESKLDECAERFKVLQPHACPFGTQGVVSGDDGLESPSDLQWTVKEYPRINLKSQTSPVFESSTRQATVVVEDSGVIQLRGKGYDRYGKQVDFSIDCEVNLEGYTVTADQRSELSLHPFDPVRERVCQL
ncbi:MAG TPA: hypothetical protein H9902_11500 [Candidatus Stackebrandtia faecavium]|nr:hypothetical protein [Candidatus Stackebrandtia faecavium]